MVNSRVALCFLTRLGYLLLDTDSDKAFALYLLHENTRGFDLSLFSDVTVFIVSELFSVTT